MKLTRGLNMSNLNDRQEMFCLEYIVDLNATQAAIRAGYSEDSAAQSASRLLTNANIQQRVAELLDERNRIVKVDAQYVLRRLTEIDQMDVQDILYDDGSMKPIREWPSVWTRTMSGLDIQEIRNGDTETILKKIKWPDKVRNLEMLGKHVDVSAFVDRSEIEMTVNPLDSILNEIEDDARSTKE